MTMQETRFQVFAHTWSDEHQRPMRSTLVGMADGMQESDRMVADHAAAHGTPADHRHYAISVAPYPDCESLARATVGRWIRSALTIEDVRRRGTGRSSLGYHVEPAGGYIFPPGHTNAIRLRPHELYCRVGFDWRVFDLRVLFAEELSGMRQGALL